MPIHECWKGTKRQPIGVRWVDVNKQDDVNPKYRSRLVAKEINRSPKPELYAAIPPPECLRMIISSVMDVAADGPDPMKLMVCDVSRACSYAPAIRPVYVRIVDEDHEPGDEDKCGRLNVSMDGTRDTALNWHQHCKGHLEMIGFRQGTSNPCIFYHVDRNIRVFIHGDDYVASGSDLNLKWMAKEMPDKYECKVHILGPDIADESQVKNLNRMTTWHGKGKGPMITYEADPRHAEIIIREFGLQDAKPLTTPVAKIEIESEERILEESQATRYKSLVAKVNYLSADRPDIQFTCRELSTSMSKPTLSLLALG